MFGSRAVFREVYDAELEPEAKSEPASLHTEITTYRNLVRKGQAKVPLEELTRLLTQDPPPYARYRILSNISAIHINAGAIRTRARFFQAGACPATRRRESPNQFGLCGAC